MSAERLQYVTPLPPLPTGIAQYSRDLLRALGGAWPLDIVGEAGSNPAPFVNPVEESGTRTTSFRRGVPTVFQIGNSGFHRLAFKHALQESGVIVLHDVMLHHGRSGELLRAGGAGYQRVMRSRYGAKGAWAVAEILAGRAVDDFGVYPLSEDYVERAIVTIVHSEFARRQVLRFVPDANVVVVPMGIPLPALVDQSAARIALKLPERAFIIASITHVNPYKRMPIVLRAMRRLVAREPDAILIVAGSVAPGIDLKRQVSLLNLERNVRLLGYVTDDEARLAARAADVCVNLRFPSAGETSASLLRLLGAGRPVLVTDDPSTAEYPRDAVLPVAVDRFEDEMLADLMLLLARDRELRASAGAAARSFIEREHSMLDAVHGYRNVIQAAFGVRLPESPGMAVHEPDPTVSASAVSPVRYSALDARIADALVGLRLAGHDATIHTVSKAA
ncbi:MAG: glycosyltransferase, partial [Thermomicrobiales bacterium]